MAALKQVFSNISAFKNIEYENYTFLESLWHKQSEKQCCHLLHNVITHAYIPDEYVGLQAILNADATGQKLYEDYVSERINGDVSLWAPVKKENNKMFRSANKKTTIKLRDKTVDLKETKDLYGRLMVLARSSRDINQKEAIGNYEFTLTPRALFSPDGTILQCRDKSKLIHLLNKLSTIQPLSQEG